MGNWEQYQQAAAAEPTVRAWFAAGVVDGFGLVCGKVSGGLDMFEFEGRAVAEGTLDAFLAELEGRGLLPLWDRITAGYAEATPSGGVHVLYRLSDGAVPGNTKLARRPETQAETDAREPSKAEARAGRKRPRAVVLIETRGEGGFTVVAPSNGTTHPSGRPWELLSGGPATVAAVTAAEREALCDAARSLDTWRGRERVQLHQAPGGGQVQASTAVLAYSPWADILAPHGWVYVSDDDRGNQLWRRPGKDEGVSASASEGGGLFVWSTSTGFETEVPYSKAAAVAVLYDDMDGAEALARYGTPAEAQAVRAAADRKRAEAAEVAQLNGQAPADPECIDVENAAVAARQLRGSLGRGRLSGLYLRDGLLVHTPRTGEDGYIMPTSAEAARGVDHGPAQVRGMDQNKLRSLIEVQYTITKPRRDKDGAIIGWSDALFPADAARSAIGAAELGIGCPNLAHLAGVTHTPVLRRDGTVLDRPGYDPGTGLLYLPSGGLDVPAVPDEPTAAQVANAVALLREPVALFPWAAGHHEANWLGAMLTPLLRLLLPPPYQMVIITATNRGSGKGYLMRLLGIVHGIATRGEFPRDRDELRKLFISTLLTTTAPVIGLDNIRGTIYSSELEALLTARTLTDRELGHSRVVTVTNDRLWVATGNNARIGGDLDRRCLPVALDPRCADPHKRAFPFSPVEWMTARRGEYLAALLTVARGWVLAGSPGADPGRSDDYARWYNALRGLLAWAGVPGEFGAEDTGDLSVVSEDDAEWGAFVAGLLRVFADESFTTADVISHLTPAVPGQAPTAAEFMDGQGHLTTLADALPGDLAEAWSKTGYGKTSGFARSLGKWLGYRDGRFTPGGLTVRMQAGRRARFRIEGEG
jgi:hypothetical protein